MSEPRGPAFGLLLPTREFVMTGRQDARALLDVASSAARLGFDSVWAGDSFAARPRIDPLVLLAAVAARSDSLTLGTAVLLGSLRHPVPTAHAIAALDRMSAGRLILGLGAGFPYPATEAEFAAAGVPFNERVGRLTATIRLWRKLWAGADPVSFESRYWEVDDLRMLPLPQRPGGPSLLLAGESDKTLQRAGELADGWLTYAPTRELFEQRMQRVRACAIAAGRPPPLTALYVTVTLDTDPARAERTLDDYLGAYYGFGRDAIGQLQALYAGTETGFYEWLHAYLAVAPQHVIVRVGALDGYGARLERVASVIHELRRGRRPPPHEAS